MTGSADGRGVDATNSGITAGGDVNIQTTGNVTGRDDNHLELTFIGQQIIINQAADDRPVRTSNLPARNPVFTGRARLLESMRAELREKPDRIQALCGLGGVGKTQLAVEYTHRYRDDYGLVWWVPAERPVTIRSSLAQLAERLGLSTGVTQEKAVAWALDALGQRDDWLVVFDNVDQPDDIVGYRPAGGHVIATSRSEAWRRLGTVREIAVFDRAEALEFVHTRTGISDGADALCTTLGNLPLALEQVASYVEQSGMGIDDYLRLFQRRHEDVLGRGDVIGYDGTVDTVWELGFARVEKVSPAGADLLRLCAFLAPDDIPVDLLLTHRDLLPDALGHAADDELDLHDAVAAVHGTSLLKLAAGSARIHRLVQLLVRKRLSQQETRDYAGTALALVAAAFPGDVDHNVHWAVCDRLLPHAMAVLDHAEEPALLRSIAYYLWVRGDMTNAKALAERALAADERRLGPNDRGLLPSLGLLGGVLMAIPDIAAALTLHTRGLAIATAGGEQAAIADQLGELGGIHHQLGNLAEAKAHTTRSLAIRERVLYPGHPHIAWCYNGLAAIARDQGDLAEAQELYRHSLRIAEDLTGSDRILIAWTLNDIGEVRRRRGDLDGAQADHRRAMELAAELRGSDHLDVAVGAYGLGLALRAAGDTEDARTAFHTALTIRRAALPETHPTVVAAREALK